MQKTYHLSQADIKAAIEAFVRNQDGEDTSQPWDVTLTHTPGDRPGESACITATATPGKRPLPSQRD